MVRPARQSGEVMVGSDCTEPRGVLMHAMHSTRSQKAWASARARPVNNEQLENRAESRCQRNVDDD